MQTLIPYIVLLQLLGAVIGVGTALWAEFAYVRAMRDGKIDHAERLHLRMIAHGLRFGLVLLLIASFGLIIVAYAAHTPAQPALTAGYWTFMGLALLITYTGWALSRHRISFPLGSAIIFSAWWFLFFIIFGKLPALTFGATILFFVVATAIFYGILSYSRMLLSGRK